MTHLQKNNRDNILRDITRLVAVPSVEGTPEPGAPFGKGPKAALDKALEIAAELGLDTHNAEGYIGWAQTGPIADGQKYLATITHTDVVPEGNGWDADPYTVRVRDGWLLGRGVADDKGPSILCLYAPEIPERQRRYPQVPRASPAGCQRGNQHARRRLFCRPL